MYSITFPPQVNRRELSARRVIYRMYIRRINVKIPQYREKRNVGIVKIPSDIVGTYNLPR